MKLVERLQKAGGEQEREAAFRELYHHCYQEMWRYGLSRQDKMSKEELQDLVAQAFIALFEQVSHPAFILRSSIKGLAVRILENKILNYFRTKKRHARGREDLITWLIRSSAQPNAEELIIEREQREEAIELVNRTLAQLNEGCQRFFRYIMRGLNYQEIAEQTGWAESGIKVKAYRCRQYFIALVKA